MRVEEPGGPNAVTVDPDNPVFQVNIFARLNEPAEFPEEQRGFLVSEWKVHDAEVTEVLAWAATKAAGWPYTVAVASAETGSDAYLLHLYGRNPLREDSGGREPYRLVADVVPSIEEIIRDTGQGQ